MGFNMRRIRRERAIVERPAAVALLASPVRQEIVDTLEALGGEAAVAAIAAQLGRPSDALYYHLRLLAEAGLVVELPGDGEGRRYRTTAGPGTRLRLRYRPGRTTNARAVVRVAGGMLRTAARDFAAAIADPRAVVRGAARELWASRTKGWVGRDELLEINRLLERLQVLLERGKSPGRTQLLSFTWVMAPGNARPLRRER
jgi:DNA-binding transcriptional ArsR family regulator